MVERAVDGAGREDEVGVEKVVRPQNVSSQSEWPKGVKAASII
jgi:hypothetical protein